MIPKKLPPIPKAVLSTVATLTFYTDEVDRYGSPVEGLTVAAKCYFSEKHKQIVNEEKQIITLEGSIIYDGDLVPGVNDLGSGKCVVEGKTYTIYSTKRHRNPDGSVHHTTVYLQ